MTGLDELLNRPAWHARAACRDMDTRIFFPAAGQPVHPDAARACAACPVAAECLDYALTNHIPHGTWAGTTENKRRALRRELPVAPPIRTRCTFPCTCEHCEREFESPVSVARFCSHSCRTKASKQRARARKAGVA
jgi:WhiB family redox-sensing transcriptional regulator